METRVGIWKLQQEPDAYPGPCFEGNRPRAEGTWAEDLTNLFMWPEHLGYLVADFLEYAFTLTKGG